MSYAQKGSAINLQFPELMATHGALEIQGLTRQQYVGFEGRPQSYYLSAAGNVGKINSAFGVVAERNTVGLANTNRWQINATHRIGLGERLVLSPSLALNYTSYKVGAIPGLNTSIFQGAYYYEALVGTALMLDSKYFLAVNYRDHVMQQGLLYAAGTNYGRLNALIGGTFAIAKVNLTPQVLVLTDFVTAVTRVSLTADYRGIIASVSYQNQNDFACAIGYEYKDRYRLTYAYDVTTSRLGIGFSDVHEIGLRLILFKNKSRRSYLTGVGLL